jgi:hypothetical protein
LATKRSTRGTAATAAVRSRVIPTAIVPSVAPSPLGAKEVRAEFMELLAAGARIRPAGLAKDDPMRLVRGRYAPTSLIELFDTRFFLSDYFQTPQLRYFIAYVVQPDRATGKVRFIYPRIVYKDGSLIWRAASHMVSSDDDFWIGKGDIRTEVIGDEEHYESVESTTDLPFEMQTALEIVARRTIKIRSEALALDLVLRNAPASRVRAYGDFTALRDLAARNPRNLIHGGRPVASIGRGKDGRKDPRTLRFVKGYEPDFRGGILEMAESMSVLYGGKLTRYRILSMNKRVQYLFFSGPLQVWMIPPQATTTELSSFGVRTVDVVVDDDLCCPGYEYHFLDDTVDPPVFYSQIPEGYAGEVGPNDDSRADASPWLNELAVIQDFRRHVLKAGAKRGAAQAAKPRFGEPAKPRFGAAAKPQFGKAAKARVVKDVAPRTPEPDTSRPAKVAKAERPAKAAKAARPAKNAKAARPAKAAKAARPAKAAKPRPAKAAKRR